MSDERYSDSPGTSRKKPSQPSKLVSLGAAADYKGDQQQQQTSGMTDLFGTMSVQPSQPQQPSQFGDGGFADFESAFGSGMLYSTYFVSVRHMYCTQYLCILDTVYSWKPWS